MPAIVFDAYGTLLDVVSINRLLTRHFAPKLGPVIGNTWRRKQLEYSWLREISETYQPFSVVTRQALAYTLNNRGWQDIEQLLDEFLAAYNQLTLFRDVAPALKRLGTTHDLLVLSNADLSMLHAALDHNGIRDCFRAVLSADTVQHFKPHPQVYQLAVDALGLPAQEITFVSSNGWDVAGAKAFGLRTIYLNRAERPEEALDQAADQEIRSLSEL